MINLDSNKLKHINKPARYVGGEVNQIIKTKYECGIVLCYPNVYEKAMSSYIVNLLYNNINEISSVYCKRCFAIEQDFEHYLISNNYELYALEDFKPVRENDIIVFVIENELDITNLINMLNLSNINVFTKDRGKSEPKIFVLPVGNVNVEPLRDFADHIFNYDNEQENIKRLLAYINNYINYAEDEQKTMIEMTDNWDKVKLVHKENSIVPSIKISNSSIIIDFGYMTDTEQILKYIEGSTKLTGKRSVSFRNQEAIDEYKMCEIIYRIKTNIDGIRILTKNLDFSKISETLFHVILQCCEKSEITFRLDSCAKELTDGGLIEKVKAAFKNDVNSIRLIIKIGLPSEMYTDIDNIFDVGNQIINIYSEFRAKDKLSMVIDIVNYIPDKNDDNIYNINAVNKLDTKIMYIKDKKYDNLLRVNVQDTDSYIKDIIHKTGNNQISNIFYDAYKLGARFDGIKNGDNKNIWDKVIFEHINEIGNHTKFSN